MSGKRIQILTLVLYVILALALLWQNRELTALRRTQDQMDELIRAYDEVSFRLRDAEKRVQELEAEEKTEQEPKLNQTELTGAYAVDVRSVDPAERTVTFEVSADLALADENAAASVVTDAAKHHGAVETALSRDENGRYTGAVTLPLEPDDRMQMRLLVSAGGVKYTQTLCTHHSIMELMPVQLRSWNGEAEYEDGKLIWSGWTFAPEDRQGAPMEVTEAKMELSGNGAMPVALDLTEEAGAYVQTPGSVGIDCGEGETVAVSFTCTDRYGLRYVFSAGWWEVKNGQAVRHWPAAARPDLRWE